MQIQRVVNIKYILCLAACLFALPVHSKALGMELSKYYDASDCNVLIRMPNWDGAQFVFRQTISTICQKIHRQNRFCKKTVCNVYTC